MDVNWKKCMRYYKQMTSKLSGECLATKLGHRHHSVPQSTSDVTNIGHVHTLGWFHCWNGDAIGLGSARDAGPMHQLLDVTTYVIAKTIAYYQPDGHSSYPTFYNIVFAPSLSQPPLYLPHHYLFPDVDLKLTFSIAFNSCKVIKFFAWKHLSL